MTSPLLDQFAELLRAVVREELAIAKREADASSEEAELRRLVAERSAQMKARRAR